MQNEKYMFGVSYAPYGKCQDPPMEEWSGDLDNMKKLNFNVVRVFAPWDRIERQEGQYDFSRQDRIFELAAQKGLAVILNIGGVFDNYCGIYPPQWLIRDYQVQWPMPTPSSPELAGVRKYACPDDPVVREKANTFLKKLIERYKDCDELISWMVWNEPYLRDTCYCPHTLKKFRDFLHEIYNGDLDELNCRWSTESPVHYRTWDEVEAPSGHGFLYGGVTPWNDWSRFCARRLYGAIVEVDKLTKEFDPRQRPTTINVCARHTAEKALDQQIDLAGLGNAVDVLGYSFYTIGFESQENKSYQKAYRLSRIRSASKAPHGKFWVLETEIGPTWDFQPPYDVRIMHYWQAVGHGAKALLGWNYRSRMSDTQVSSFHMNAWDGGITERAEVNGEFSGLLQHHAKFINDAIPEKQAAVLCFEQSLRDIASACGASSIYRKAEFQPESRQVELYHRSRPGAFKMLWDMNIPVDFISEANISSLHDYKLLLVPMQFNMSPELAVVLREYVERGGTIIAEAPFAFKDNFNILQEEAPGFGLKDVFGGYTSDMLAGNAAPDILIGKQNSSAGNIYQYFELCGGSAAARYADGGIAAVRNEFGQGRTLLMGTDAFRMYFECQDEAMTGFLRNEIMAADVKPAGEIRVDGELLDASEIEIRKLKSGESRLVIIINHGQDAFTGDISIDGTIGHMECLKTGKMFDALHDITLPANGVLVLKCPQ